MEQDNQDPDKSTLSLAVREGQTILLGDDPDTQVEIVIKSAKGSWAKCAIRAPRTLPIRRVVNGVVVKKREPS